MTTWQRKTRLKETTTNRWMGGDDVADGETTNRWITWQMETMDGDIEWATTNGRQRMGDNE
jgi:hypothetical protein